MQNVTGTVRAAGLAPLAVSAQPVAPRPRALRAGEHPHWTFAQLQYNFSDGASRVSTCSASMRSSPRRTDTLHFQLFPPLVSSSE
jgi:hypothetical protein